MDEFAVADLPDWVADQTMRELPYVFDVVDELWLLDGREDTPVASALREFGATTETVPESGATRFRFEGRRFRAALDAGRDELSDLLLQASHAADAREYRTVGLVPDAADAVIASVRSSFPESGLPAVGPGGGATAFAAAGGVVGDVVIRRHGGIRAHGRWRLPEEVVRDLGADDLPDDVRVSAELGYFEAGPRTVQQVFRPVFHFVLDRPQPEDAGAGWSRADVIPATVDCQLPPSLGLESWWNGA